MNGDPAEGSAAKTGPACVPAGKDEKPLETGLGVGYGVSAFLIWGLSPLYWKTLASVPPLEIIFHRIVWSFVFLLPLLFFTRHWAEFRLALRRKTTVLLLFCSALVVAVNWLIYIWAVNTGHIVQAGLGYYINPLVNAALGTLVLKERLRMPQKIAIGISAVAVLIMTLRVGVFPWISLALAFSFGTYGLIRKMISTGAMAGLAVETLLLSLPSLGALIYLHHTGTGAFFHQGLRISLLLPCAALCTALPLLLFTMSARRLHYATVGIIQYIGPTGMLILGVFLYNEPFGPERAMTFGMIWLALFIYSTDSWLDFRRRKRAAVSAA